MIYAFRAILCVLYTILWGFLGVLVSLVDRSGEGVIWVGRTWVRWILATCRVRVVAEGLENVPRSTPVIFMSNHQSLFDIAAIVNTLPVSFRFVAKKELARIPLFGWAMRGGGHIIVDRQNRERAVRSLERAGERVRAGTNVIIFPEGTRSSGGELQPFKSGGFYLALAAKVPIIPVTVAGSDAITPKHSLRIESGSIKITFGKPIPTLGLTLEDRNELKERVREAILAGYDPQYQRPPRSVPQAERAPARSSA